MITIKQQEKLLGRIKTLSELELEAVFKEICEHLQRNDMRHIIKNVIDPDDFESEAEELTDTLSDMENERDEKIDDLSTIDSICDEAEGIEDFEDPEKQIEELKSIIKRIQDVCSN